MFVSSQSLEMPFSVQAIEYFAMVCSHQVYHGGWELVFGLNLGFQLTVTLIKDKNKQTNNKKPKETNKKEPSYSNRIHVENQGQKKKNWFQILFSRVQGYTMRLCWGC